MSNRIVATPLFTCSRQRPTHDPDEVEELGQVEYPRFVELLRSINWRHEANQAEWAMKASPTLAVTNQGDGCTLWVSGVVAGSIIDVDAEPDERFKVDRYEPWYSVGMKNPPEIANVTALDPHAVGDKFGFTAWATERVEECFELFFEEDYQTLYELYRWL